MKEKPLISVIIPTLVRDNLYRLVAALLKQQCPYSYEIILIPQKPFIKEKLADEKIHIYPAEANLGVSYYRNQGIAHARGTIIAFIDDDEMPQDKHWLKFLVEPIAEKKARVTTAGSFIPLKQGYIADSISLLGYPGGAALGFSKIWDVDENNFTGHLCSGNFAAEKSLLVQLGCFADALKQGKEDVFLSDRLAAEKINVTYFPKATVNHLPRKNIIEFARWHIQRGKAIFEYKQLKSIDTAKIKSTLRVAGEAIKASAFTKYFPLVLILLFLQNICQLLGFYLMKFHGQKTPAK